MNPLANDSDDDEDHDKFSALLDDVDTLLSSSQNVDSVFIDPMAGEELFVDVSETTSTILRDSYHPHFSFANIIQHLTAAGDVLSEQDRIMSAKVSLRLCNEASEMLRSYIFEEETSKSKQLEDDVDKCSYPHMACPLLTISSDSFKIIAEYLPSWEKVIIGLTGRDIQKMLIGCKLDLTENNKISSRATNQAILYQLSPARLCTREERLLNSLCTCSASRVFQSMDVGSSLSINHKSDLYVQSAAHEENNGSLVTEIASLASVGFHYRWNITGLPLLEENSSACLLPMLHKIHSKDNLTRLQVGPRASLIFNAIVQASQAGLIPNVSHILYYHNHHMHFQFLGSLSAFAFCGRNLTTLNLCDFKNGGMAKVSGDVSSLKSCKLLRSLFLGGEHIHGNLSELCGLKQLEHLCLCCTQVEGQLKALGELPRLQLLDLSHSSVSGGLEALSEIQTLQFISVINTKLEGSLTSLQVIPSLKFFLVSKTLINRRADARNAFARMNPNCEVDLSQHAKSPLFTRKYWDFFNLL